MSERLPFQSFIDVIQKPGDSPRLKSISPAAEFIGIPTVGTKHFVAPDIEVEEEQVDPSARVLLVSAPAAVGKSSIAKQLGLLTNSMVWDLSHFSLGSSFFTGTLVDAFGTQGLELVQEGLRAGSQTLILDAADEALVRSGASNFEAALNNLVALLDTGADSGPAAIILGRPDTIEETFSILARLGVRAQILRVAFFNEAQARSFVRAKAQRDGRRGVAEEELTQFLSDFFEVVGVAVGSGDWQSSESFLGYAPVLDALGAFYREQENPVKRLSQIRLGATSSHVWDLLLEVIESILDRESEKFGAAFGAGDPRKELFGKAAYSRATQLALLLSDEPDEIEVSPPDFPDAEDAWVYDELTPQMRVWYQEHPFLRGPEGEPNPLLRFASSAFRDYALAATFVSISDADAARLLDFWLDARVTPSPMLSRFCLSDLLELSDVPADVFTMVADSHASGFLSAARMEIEVQDVEESAGEFEGNLFLVENLSESRRIRARFSSARPLNLARGVVRTLVDAPLSVVAIGAGSQDFVIGPNASISCAQLQAESSEIRVRTERGVANDIRTGRIIGSTRRISGAGSDGLRVTVPVAVFPWQAYRSHPGDGELVSDAELYWAGMDFRRNFKWFARESMVGGGLNYPVVAMETILNKGRASREIHDYLLERRYLSRRGASWVLELPSISGAAVVANEVTEPQYRDLLVDLVLWSSSSRG